MTKDLAYYRLLPYEREWLMREEGAQKYFVVRLKDLPAVAGDGSSCDRKVEVTALRRCRSRRVAAAGRAPAPLRSRSMLTRTTKPTSCGSRATSRSRAETSSLVRLELA